MAHADDSKSCYVLAYQGLWSCTGSYAFFSMVFRASFGGLTLYLYFHLTHASRALDSPLPFVLHGKCGLFVIRLESCERAYLR